MLRRNGGDSSYTLPPVGQLIAQLLFTAQQVGLHGAYRQGHDRGDFLMTHAFFQRQAKDDLLRLAQSGQERYFVGLPTSLYVTVGTRF